MAEPLSRMGARMMPVAEVSLPKPPAVEPRAVDCEANPNLCEKPVNSDTLKIPITLGVVIPVVLAIFFFIYLHRRSMARQRREDAIDFGKNDDFGMSATVTMGRKKGGDKNVIEKNIGHKNHQLSMDMDMSTPYLLPPGINDSHESLSSLARSLNTSEDPYRPVTSYGKNNETESVRSWKPANSNRNSIHTMASIRTGKSVPRPGVVASSGTGVAPPRQNSLPKPAPAARLDMATVDNTPQFGHSPHDVHALEPMSATIEETSYIDRTHANPLLLPSMPEIQEPEPAIPRTPRSGLPDRPKWDPTTAPPASSSHPLSSSSGPSFAPGGLDLTAPKLDLNLDSGLRSPELDNSFQSDIVSSSTPPRDAARPSPSFAAVDSSNNHPDSPFHDNHHINPQFTIHDNDDDDDYYNNNNNPRRHSHELHFDNDDAAPPGLSVPPSTSNRMSIGQRPLPPSDIVESDDPEYRANRIRSFYKEYFGDLADDRPPVPALPGMLPMNHRPGPGGPDGPPLGLRHPGPHGPLPPPGPRRGPPPPIHPPHPDSDELGYYDADHNTFVMPYAQPVTRRAMTPPPRFRGGPGPDRPNHGSIDNMSSAGPRPGSSVSNRFNNNSQPGSRAGSSMSNVRGRNPAPKPRGPPPADLSTLPAASKLMDDGLAILGTLDFAPPTTYAERTRGRSQSPSGGERRPYRAGLPVHSPLISPHGELSAMPSPHMLRKSGAFNTLDFAPPRKFHDVSDNKSDAGSIRSNVSKVNLAALRDQSHLPDTTIFSADDSSKLRPQWGMRD